MARIITKQHAKKIAKKLKAKKRKSSGAHDHYDIWKGEELLFSISIRRASEKDKGHDHIPVQLKINAHKAKEFADCSYSLNQYMIDRGFIEAP